MAETAGSGDAREHSDLIHEIVQILTDGGIVALPTEAGYVTAASVLSDTALERLPASNGKTVLLARSIDEAVDFLPQLEDTGRRVMRRCWPGPVVLQCPAAATTGGLCSSLSETGRSKLLSDELDCWVPSESLFHDVARLLSAPLAAAVPDTPVTSSDDPENVDLVVTIDEIQFPQGPTYVRITGSDTEVTKEGVVGAATVRRMMSQVILFVCTGNTCRSPMAEGLFRTMLCERLGVEADQLDDRGFIVASAGIAAGYGMPASPESAELLADRGIDIGMHASQPLTERLLNQTDFVYTMTRGHRNAILAQRPDLADRVQVLAPDGSDVPDPIGGGMEEYRRCQHAIESYLEHVISRLSLPSS